LVSWRDLQEPCGAGNPWSGGDARGPCRLIRDWTDERGQGVVVGRLGL